MEPLTVSELTVAIKNSLEPAFSHLTLQGEVSNFKQQSSGHLYFSLKDADAQISAVMFAGHAAKLKTLPKAGDHVVVKGDLNVYAPRGNYQIVIHELTQMGLGALLLKLEQLKLEIHRRGWFGKEHKKPLPHLPKRIGIVTSPTGAVIQDILHVLGRRFAGLHILLNPVKVQGEGAAEEIAKAIEDFNKFQLCDVMIVGRGGGSIEDLFAFNEEVVAKAIFESQIPIICAVGHETDHCIAEYVADVRAPTPSAAAEMVIAEKRELIDRLSRTSEQLTQLMKKRIAYGRDVLKSFLKLPLFSTPYPLLGQRLQRLDDLREQTEMVIHQQMNRFRVLLEGFYRAKEALRPATQIANYKQKISTFEKAIHIAIKNQLARREELLKRVVSTLKAVNPKNVLQRGYAIVFSEKTNSVITTVKSVEKNERVRITLSDGEALGTIDEVKS